MELVLLVGWLRPLALWRHQVNPWDGAPMVTFLGRTRTGALQFAVPAVLLAALYAAAVWLALRARGRLATAVALAAPVVFAATLVPMFPGGTQDIFHNVADGRLLWRYGENPTLVPPAAHPGDPFYPHLFGYVDLPSTYGPLWYALAGVPVALAGDGFAENLIAQKAMMAFFLLATMLLVWAVARGGVALTPRPPRPHAGEGEKHAPLPREVGEGLGVGAARPCMIASARLSRDHATAAAVIVGWCPLLLWETAGNGHNDVIMVFLAAAAVAAAAWRRWLWVFPLLALSALVKFTTVLLGPVLLVWMLRRGDVPRRTLVTGLALAALLVALAYVPFWAGRDTLTVLKRPGMTFILSPATIVHGALTGRLAAGTATRLTQTVTGALFAALYALTLARIRPGRESFNRAGFDATFAYLVFASWWFWPWYLSWLAPFAAWQAGDRRCWVFVAITSAALLTYCYWWADPPERSRQWFVLYSLLTAGVFTMPCALWAAGWRKREPRVDPHGGQ